MVPGPPLGGVLYRWTPAGFTSCSQRAEGHCGYFHSLENKTDAPKRTIQALGDLAFNNLHLKGTVMPRVWVAGLGGRLKPSQLSCSGPQFVQFSMKAEQTGLFPCVRIPPSLLSSLWCSPVFPLPAAQTWLFLSYMSSCLPSSPLPPSLQKCWRPIRYRLHGVPSPIHTLAPGEWVWLG